VGSGVIPPDCPSSAVPTTDRQLANAGQTDLGFALPLRAAGTLNAAPPLRLPGVLVPPPWHRLASKPVVELRELEGEPCVSLRRQYQLRDVAETQNGAAACEMVAQGLGSTIASVVSAMGYGRPPALRRLRPTAEFPIHVLTPPGRHMSRTATDFLAMVHTAILPLIKRRGQPDVVAARRLRVAPGSAWPRTGPRRGARPRRTDAAVTFPVFVRSRDSRLRPVQSTTAAFQTRRRMLAARRQPTGHSHDDHPPRQDAHHAPHRRA
jgi:hypothetical protein